MTRTILLFFFLVVSTILRGADTLSVLQWNVWQEGTQVKGGYEAIVDEIVRLKPDFITLSEVRNYHNTNFTRRLTDALAAKGVTYYSFYSYDTGVLSRHPFTDSLTVYPCRNDHGSIYGLHCTAHGRKFAVYTAHLDYQNDTYYEVRGYDGSTWRPMRPLTDVAEILRRNARSRREEAIGAFIRQAERDKAEGYAVIIGGDFNEPSLLDWTERTRFIRDHHGVVCPWPVSRLLLEAGFTDAYRTRFPDELLYPGFTYPSDNADVSPSRLTWAPLADERDRIDFIHFRGEGLKLRDARIFGPEGCIVYGARRSNPGKDSFIAPLGTWPTDHKGVWCSLELQ